MSAPVSWLSLELYHAGDLSAQARAEVEVALAEQPLARDCLEQIEADASRPLPPLPRPAPHSRHWWPVLVSGAALAATASVLLAVTAAREPLRPAPRLAIKGGEVAMSLVRERHGATVEPTHFAATDRFAVELTCPSGSMSWDLVVLDEDGATFPLSGGVARCGNRVRLPGAFRLEGETTTQICLLFGDLPSRESLNPEQLPPHTVCVEVDPER